MKTVFLRACETDDKAATLRAAIAHPEAALGIHRFQVDVADFSTVPRSPFAYWVSDRLLGLFSEAPLFNEGGRTLSIGASTKNDFRYVRASFEVLPSSVARSRADTSVVRWVPFAKGGSFSPFYADVHLVVDWSRNGAMLKADISEYRGSRGWGYQWSAALNGHDHYFRPGLTWPRRTQGGLSLRAMPSGCIFADKGPAAFVKDDEQGDLLALLAVVNTSAFRALVDLQMAFGSYEVGVIQRTPIPDLGGPDRSVLADLAHRSWSLRRSMDTRTEASHAFVLPALLQIGGDTLGLRAVAWVEHVRVVEAELLAIQSEIDERCFDLYGIDEADRVTITEGVGGGVDAFGESDEAEANVEADDGSDVDSGEDPAALVAELVSWAVGVAFGRFDARLATGARALPAEPEPLDPLPVCSPGMLTGEDGLPTTCSPLEYPLGFPVSGILVDDPGDPRDLTSAVHAVFEAVFGASADAFWQEAAALLDPRSHDLRAWLGSGLFEHHLKHHSKSRRKAPILWQLGTQSGRYSAWLYAHRLTVDSLFELQSDVVAPKLAYEERQLTTLVEGSGDGPSAKERREIATQEAFVDELRALLDDVKRAAPLWQSTLDDGVMLAMAPLWQLVPHKPWQRELRAKWAELAAGKYDWAHLAMHLWPERVVPKCAADRSLAIAHDLGTTFWEHGTDGKWTARAVDHAEVARLIGERTSPTVTDALQNGQVVL